MVATRSWPHSGQERERNRRAGRRCRPRHCRHRYDGRRADEPDEPDGVLRQV